MSKAPGDLIEPLVGGAPELQLPAIKMTLAQVRAQSITAAEQARLAALAARPDSEIDFSDQEEITPEAIAAGNYRIVGRGGARLGAGRKPTGKLRKMVKLSPQAVKRFQAYAQRKKLPHFSDALEAASRLL